MLKTQIDNYDMFLSQENLFEDNPTLWSGNAPIVAVKTLVSSKIDVLAENAAIQLLNPSGITADKKNVRTTLENQGFVLCSAICSYAAAGNKMELYNRSKFVKSDFTRFRDAELVGVVTNLHRDATAELANLAPFGVTASVLTSILASNNAFGLIMKNPEMAIAKRKGATDKIAVLIPEITEILETRMDNLMVGLQATQPQFVDMYHNVRALNSTQVNPLSLTVTTVEAVTNVPVAKANLEIVGEGIFRVSSERGYNTVQNLTAGPHQILATHPNFVSQTINFSIVSGETTELIVVLERA